VTNNLKTRLKGLLPARLEQGIRRLLLRRRINAFQKRIVEHAYLGHSLKISIQDDLAEEWYDNLYGSGSMSEIEFLQRSRLKTGARVFDLGAHQGVVAMILARLVGDSGSVIAVEGTQHNADIAVENCRLNGITNVTVKHAVAAEQAGLKMSFSATLNGAVGDNLLPVEVTSVSIDSLADEHGIPDVVFVDVEGYECHVLDGGKKILSASTDFFVEVHAGAGLERHGSVEKVLAYFPAPKYTLFWSPLEGAEFRPLSDRANAPHARFYLIAFAQ
jgi:FkbM family methyltransferase